MKPFSFSYSKLKNFETCPKKYYEVDVCRRHAEDTTELDWGNRVHDAFKVALRNNQPLPRELGAYQKWANSVLKWRTAGAELLIEQKYALTKELQPSEYFGPNVWYRGIGDVVGIAPPVAMALDWKTGKLKNTSETQLMLLATCIMMFHQDVHEVETSFVSLKDDTSTDPVVFTRAGLSSHWVPLFKRVEALEAATKNLDFPPRPGPLCKRYCPVTSCPFHGKGSF
jgi:hypothetical protein